MKSGIKSGSRFGETFRYELYYRLGSASTWLYGVFIFLLAFWIIHVSATGGHEIASNAPFKVAETMALFCGLFGMLVTAGLFADAALRDRASRMDPLLFTTRLRPAEYLGGRFLAALLVNAILVIATPIGLWFAAQMPYLDRRAFGPDRFLAYLQPLLLFTLPNLVLVGAILFAIAVLTRQAVAVYLGAIAILIGYIVAATFWSTITNPMLSVLADPFGINALKGMTEYWTAIERNTNLVGFPTMLIWNRLLWLGVAAVIFAALQRIFYFTERFAKGEAETPVDAPSETSPRRARSPEEPRNRGTEEQRYLEEPRNRGTEEPVPQVFGPGTRARQTVAIARDALSDIVSGRAFQIAFVAAIGLVLLWGWNIGVSYVETITWPVTHLVAGVVLAQRSIIISWLVIVIFAGELVWKDRESGAAEIADAVPVRTGVVLLGRFLALVGLIVLFQFAFMIGGILLQVLQGYYVFEPLLYVKILFGIKLVDFVILAALAMTMHVLVDHKYAGHILVLMAMVFCQAGAYGIHHLAIYNSGPDWQYSEMNGFGPFIKSFMAFKLYWAAWALLLLVVALLFWARGPQLGIRQRLATARARLSGTAARLAGLSAVLILAFGGFIFYNTNVLNEHLPPHREGEPQAEYERRYSRYRDLPQPSIASANLRLELYPEDPAVDITGTYQLVNKTAATIRDVHIETPRNVGGYRVRSMTFDRAAKARLADPKYGYRIFTLQRPLAPGESLQFKFDVAFRPTGFPHGGWQTKLVSNGSYFDRMLLPFVGYQPFEVTDENLRKQYGLPARRGMPDPSDADAGSEWSRVGDRDRMHAELVVGTALDQTVFVPGVLRRSWTENGRRYFHYGTRQPEHFVASVFSGRYGAYRGRWRDVTLQIFHHPPHRATLARMMGAMRSSLDYYTAQFGPYQFKELTIVEIPPYSINGRAFPSAVAFAEQNFITRTGDGLVDLTYFGTAHEVAHQWWGGQVRPAYAKGRSFVSEAVSNYSAMMVTETVLGQAKARKVYDYQMDRYLSRRAETGRDVPLLVVDDHPHISYGKGAVALYTMREHIGAAAVNGALKRFLEKYGRTGPPYATSLDLYAELSAATPPELHPLLTDLFETITLWEIKTQSATTRRLPNGQYEVTLNVYAQKQRADEVGRETPTPMNDLVEVGVFAAGKDAPIYQARHRIKTGQQTLKISVASEPARAGFDPEGKLIERERGDNVVEVGMKKGQWRATLP